MIYKLAILPVLLLSGCSYFTFNAAMCDKIATDPQATVPQECRDYDKKKAEKASNRVIEDKKVSKKDIEFSKEQSE